MADSQAENRSRECPARVSQEHLRDLAGLQHLFPAAHTEYLHKMARSGVQPRVIFDVGANVLHWTRAARGVWPDAEYYAFEAMEEVAPLYEEENISYHLAALSNRDGREVKFYVSPQYPGGNSYYRENPEVTPGADEDFTEQNVRFLRTRTLDSVVQERGWPLPDLIKMDIQGAEMDVLEGAQDCLKHCQDLILELQLVEYNLGAPLRDEVIAYVSSLGFRLRTGPFFDAGSDGDYHFEAV